MYLSAKFFLIVFLCKQTFGIEQKCIMGQSLDKRAQMSEIPQQKYYACKIDHAFLSDQNETVVTNTSSHSKNQTDFHIKFVYYWLLNYVKFIPNTIFTQFPSIEYFTISDGQGFVTMKAEYLRNATKLKYFYVYKNKITELGPNLFLEAPNLEHINLQANRIECIDKLAFSGLFKIQGVYLQQNKIKNLHSDTFTQLRNLNKLNLLNNTCIDRSFIKSDNISIAKEIPKKCVYNMENIQLATLSAKIEELLIVVEYGRKNQLSLRQSLIKMAPFEANIKNITSVLQENIIKLQKNVQTVTQEIRDNVALKKYSMIIEESLQNLSKASEHEKEEFNNSTQKRLDFLKLDFDETIQKAFTLITSNLSQILIKTDANKDQLAEINRTIEHVFKNHENLSSETQKNMQEIKNQVNDNISQIWNKFEIFSTDLVSIKSNLTKNFSASASDDEINQLKYKMEQISKDAKNMSRIIKENFNKSQSNNAEMEKKSAVLKNNQYIALAGIFGLLIIILILNIACVIRNSQCKKNLSLEQDVMCEEFEEKLTLNKLRKLYAE